jgi:cardiolipin synthase
VPLQAGIEIHVYQPTLLHTTLLAIDAELVPVSWTSFDLRSIRLDDEPALTVYNPAHTQRSRSGTTAP